MTENQKLIDGLTSALSEANLQFRLLDPKLSASLAALYSESVTGAVVDEVVGGVPDQAWLDLLGSLGRRMPIFVLGTKKHGSAKKVTIRNAELFTYVSSSSPNDLLSLMMASGAIASPGSTPVFAAVPFFNIQVPLHMLKSTGAVSLISINATGLRKIAIDFGVEAYQRLQKCFQNILNSMWGSPGCFRRTDILMRRSTHSNTYYVILEQSRRSLNVPAPGVIEKMADRIALRIQKEMWNEIYKFGADRKLPDCISLAPEVSVGYSTALHNPCVDSYEIIEHLIEASSEVAKVQGRRIKDRACELMHTLIQTDQLLYPNYQGVFTLPGLTKEMVDTAKAENSIKAYSSLVYGFEALIRVRSQIVQEAVSGDHLFHMEARLLRPDILFALAHEAKVALELDQVCLALGVRDASDLPGKLMINILPRNLLHLERLTHLLGQRRNIVFEISESEGISNPQLMMRMREYISNLGCFIAADDFGKGYASIDRIMKLRPEIIKLDRSLVDGIHKDPAKQSFVEGIIRAAKHVQATVLAEGIELWEEAAVVQAMGVDLIQGFLLHKPQPVEEVLKQLEIDQTSSLNQGLDRVA